MKNQRGLSLVELLIAITLGLVLMTGVIQMFLASRTVFSTQQSISRSQETGRLAIDFIARDARNVGFYGCYRPIKLSSGSLDIQNRTLAISGLHKNFDIGIMGYDDYTKLPDTPSTDLGLATVAGNSSILVIRGAGQNGAVINAVSAPTSIAGYTPNSVSGNCVGDICKGGAVVASNCDKARFFLTSSFSLAGTTVTLNHPDTWGATEGFNKGELLPLNTTVYFVAKGAGGQNSLWQRVNDTPPVELLEGVERIYVSYATTDHNYRSAAKIAASEWLDVVSARVEILVRSLEDNVVADPQPYTFNKIKITPSAKNDVHHMFQVFSTTIDLRNRETFSK